MPQPFPARICPAVVGAYHPFGFEVTGHTTFDGVTITSAGRGGWFFGTDRWADGEFMRYEITDYRLVTEDARRPL
jgi:hypothetical protein